MAVERVRGSARLPRPQEQFPPGTATSVAAIPGSNGSARFHVVRLDGGELLALLGKDPGSRCAVQYRPDFVLHGRMGWFRNPCRGTMYGMAGQRACARWSSTSTSVTPLPGMLLLDAEVTGGPRDTRYRVHLAGPGSDIGLDAGRHPGIGRRAVSKYNRASWKGPPKGRVEDLVELGRETKTSADFSLLRTE